MVKIYDSIKDEYGNVVTGVTKLFITSTTSDNTVGEFISGIASVPEGNGTMFIVDEWLIPQVDKLLFINGELKVKDGETIDEPVKTETQLHEEELLRQLAELRAKKNEDADK